MKEPAVAAIVVSLALTLYCSSHAQAPRVQIAFQLKEPQYIRAFTASERQQLEDSATARPKPAVAPVTRAHFPFSIISGPGYFLSSSANTSLALRKASTPAGTPQ